MSRVCQHRGRSGNEKERQRRRQRRKLEKGDDEKEKQEWKEESNKELREAGMSAIGDISQESLALSCHFLMSLSLLSRLLRNPCSL